MIFPMVLPMKWRLGPGCRGCRGLNGPGISLTGSVVEDAETVQVLSSTWDDSGVLRGTNHTSSIFYSTSIYIYIHKSYHIVCTKYCTILFYSACTMNITYIYIYTYIIHIYIYIYYTCIYIYVYIYTHTVIYNLYNILYICMSWWAKKKHS